MQTQTQPWMAAAPLLGNNRARASQLGPWLMQTAPLWDDSLQPRQGPPVPMSGPGGMTNIPVQARFLSPASHFALPSGSIRSRLRLLCAKLRQSSHAGDANPARCPTPILGRDNAASKLLLGRGLDYTRGLDGFSFVPCLAFLALPSTGCTGISHLRIQHPALRCDTPASPRMGSAPDDRHAGVKGGSSREGQKKYC